MKTMRGIALLLTLLAPSPAWSEAPSFRMSEVTPVGSWAEREMRTVDERGRETVAVMRQTLVGTEERDGELHYWVETETTNYKLNKKGQKKPQGDTAVIKVLIAGSTFDGDPGSIVNNLTGFGKEIIMQAGDGPPMRMREGGMMAGFMMKALGVQMEYQFDRVGTETVETPAGSFEAEKFSGIGSVETRMLMQKMSVQSQSLMWMSPEIPFGFARMESEDTVNGKPQKVSGVVTAFAMSGGQSKIVGEPVDFMGGQGLLPGS